MRLKYTIIPVSISLLVAISAFPRDIPGYSVLEVGDAAPTFELASPDGGEITNLGQFKGKTPVVLFFGSYT